MKQVNKESPFLDIVELALKHYSDPTWLGEESPLASPYFLGAHLSAHAITTLARGRVLQELLRKTTAQITGRYSERYKTILHEYYFQQRSVDVVSDLVGLGRNSFHLSRNDAIAALADQLVAQINPALRLESPPQIVALLERETQLQQCLAALSAGHAVTLMGGGGMGKTTLGGALATNLRRATFWFTIRPGLNDHLEAFLFALGYFLHTHGSSSLWLESIADVNKFKPDRLVGIARYALEQLAPTPPLLCIDEVDLLNPTDDSQHVPLVKLLESLRGVTPLLLIGQRPIIETGVFCMMVALSLKATRELFEQAGIHLIHTQLTEIYNATQGNPRLLELLIALQRTGEPLDKALQELSHQPSIEFLLSRILQRLDDRARSVMLELSVFRRPAPTAVWENEQRSVDLRQVTTLHLAQFDRSGGVALLPTYRTLIYQLLPAEKRQALHASAARVRAVYGDYAACVYHWVQAGQPEQAIWLWYEYRQVAINQGQAQAALTLLRSLRSMSLSPLARETLTFLCAELERLTGNAVKALADIHSILWQTPVIALGANYLAGLSANDQGEFEQAETAFRQSLTMAERMVELQLSHLHRGLGWRYVRERDITRALHEAKEARYQVEQFQGVLQREIANYALAEAHYVAALQIAEELGYQEGIAKTCGSLALLYATQGKFEQFFQYMHRTNNTFERLGRFVELASHQINCALAYNLAGDFEQARKTGEDAQTRLARLGPMPPRQQLLIDAVLGEAHLGLNNLDEATLYARRVIEAENIELLPDGYRTMGEILRKRGQHRDAIQLIRASIEIAAEHDDHYVEGFGWRALGATYQAADERQYAAEAFTKAITLFQSINLPNEVEKTYAVWSVTTAVY